MKGDVSFINAETFHINSMFSHMKLITQFYLCLLISFLMQNIHFNEFIDLQNVVPTSVEGHSKSSQEVGIVFAQIKLCHHYLGLHIKK